MRLKNLEPAYMDSDSVDEILSLDQSGGEKNFKCIFEGCQAAFGRQNRLIQHVRVHTGERPYKCHECGQSYTRNFHLTRHIQSTHNKAIAPKFICPVEGCGGVFSTQQNLRRHHSGKHEKQSENVCKDCGKSFKKHQQLKIHQFEHTGIKPFKCPHEGCDKSFLLPSKLKRHSKVHDGYNCDYLDCGQHFNTWSLLQEHKKEAHKKAIVCDICQATFTAKPSLRDHLETHKEIRMVFHCPIDKCERWYYFERNLMTHLKNNHETGHYQCKIEGCERTFTSKGSYKTHVSRHNKKPKVKEDDLITQRKQRTQKVRKDKGLPKKAVASLLSGHLISPHENLNLIGRVA